MKIEILNLFIYLSLFSAMESRFRLVEGESPEREGVDLFML